MQPLECLQRYPLFNLLTPAQLQTWLRGGQELAVPLGETILQEAAAGVWAHLVLEGQVRIVRRSAGGHERTLGQIGPGEVFGDYALLPPHRNTATCRAASSTRLLSLPLLPLRPVLAAIPGVGQNLKSWFRLHGLLGYLREQVFLGFMSAPSALTFLDRLEAVVFPALRTIQADGLADDCWYFIQEGQVALHPADDAKKVPPRELGPGACFGEQALAGRAGLPVAVTLSDTRCLRLSREAFAARPEETADRSQQSLKAQMSSWRKPFVWIGQQETADCGVAALAMVARYHGLDVSVEGLRRDLAVGKNGMSLLELQRAALGLGFRCQPARVSREQFGQVATPAIAHCQNGHYVVLYEFGANGVVIGDPTSGIVRLSQEMFARTCSGRLLLVQRKSGVISSFRPQNG